MLDATPRRYSKRRPILGEFLIPGPLRLSEQTESLDLAAPLLGEHNNDVLTELGYDASDIARLTESGVLCQGDR